MISFQQKNFLNTVPRLIYSAFISTKKLPPTKLINDEEETSNENWKARSKLAEIKIQRNEDPAPKQFWVEDWKLEIDDENYTPLKEYGTNTKKWKYYNNVVWPPNYIVPETGLPKSREVFHCFHTIHYSPKKMWYVCQFIRRMNVDEAIKQLKFKENKGTIIMSQLLTEAKEKAKDECHIEDPDKMFVAEAFPIQKFIVKGLRRHAQGQIHTRRFRYIDVFVRLEEGTPPGYKERIKPLNGWEKMEKYYGYLRSRDFKYSI